MTELVLERARLRPRVQAALDDFLQTQQAQLSAISPDLVPLIDVLSELLAGGKRLRPAFAYWGHLGAGGQDGAAIIGVGAALELFQACALIHDDVMDGSDTRRGAPAVHRRFQTLHAQQGWVREGEQFGVAAAILLGDLCLGWAQDLLDGSGFDQEALVRARTVFAEMRTEVTVGQFLDVLEQARGGGSLERARQVIRFKSATYTCERPLQLGGALAGAGPLLQVTWSEFGLALGEAFQLRDDLLGVFGDPAATGKPAGDDLREGKRTVLIAAAHQAADEAQRALLRRLLGDPYLDEAGVSTLRTVLLETGAVARVEAMVTERTEQALAALAAGPVRADARLALQELAVAATTRQA